MRFILNKEILVSCENKRSDVSDVYDNGLLSDINALAGKMQCSSDYINEIFLYFYIKFDERVRLLKQEGVKDLSFKREATDNLYIWQGAAIESGVNMPIFSLLFFFLRGLLYILLSLIIVVFSTISIPLYTIFKFPNPAGLVSINNYDSVSVIRAPATYSKMNFIKKPGLLFLSDDFAYKDANLVSLYRVNGLFSKFTSLFYVPFYAVRDFFNTYLEAKKILGFGMSGYVLFFFAKRIAHKCNFEFYLNHLIKQNKFDKYYTGNKEDRFALMEKRLCQKYKLECVCIPHGLEYSYKMPGELVGDTFYCTSQYARDYLAKLYGQKSISFIFDEGIANGMFSRNISGEYTPTLVFFPESREPEINLQIMTFIVDSGFSLFVKLHVKDNLNNYLPIKSRIKLIDSFDEAISNKICLARKSTVLLEALYNNSVAISVLINDTDKAYVDLMFPSLSDPKIRRVESFPELEKLLNKLVGEESI